MMLLNSFKIQNTGSFPSMLGFIQICSMSVMRLVSTLLAVLCIGEVLLEMLLFA
jgi:hypothetical protein